MFMDAVSQFGSIKAKRVARVATVQFMYEMQMTGKVVASEEDINRFLEVYINEKINLKFFRKLVSDIQEATDLDQIIMSALENDKAISNSPPVEICIIKVALAEMIFENTDIPVIINEYVDISKDFLDQKSSKFINALLDKISKTVRRPCQSEA